MRSLQCVVEQRGKPFGIFLEHNQRVYPDIGICG